MRGFLGLCAAVIASVPAAAQTPLDLAARITEQCGAPGYKWLAGCRVTLPEGHFTVGTTRVGDCTTATARVGLTIEGQGAGTFATVPRFPMASTVLDYEGPPGRPVLDFCGASNLTVKSLAIDGRGAGSVVRVSADNARSAISHFVHLADLTISGGETGIELTGASHNDQTDFVSIDRVSISDVDTCLLQDSQQTVGNAFRTLECAARKAGFVIRGGSLDCDGCYVTNWPPYDPGFMGFYLTKSVLQDGRGFTRHQASIRNSHMELVSGRFIVEDAAVAYPILTHGNSYSVQCSAPGCEMLVLDSQAKAPVTMIGDVVQAATPSGASPKARVCQRGGALRAIGVYARPNVAALAWQCL